MREDPITLRVAARFQREVVATFISDKWFKAKRAELVAILKIPVKAHRAEMWANDLGSKVFDFLAKFEEEFNGMVTYEPALESVQRRVKDAKNSLDSIVHSLDIVSDYMMHPDFKNPMQYLEWYAASAIHDKIAESTKTLGGFFKWGWTIDEGVVDRLVLQTLNRATSEQRESLTSEYVDQIDAVRYNYLTEVRFKEKALKALKRTKLDSFDPLKWLGWMYETLESNYTEQAVADHGAYREFDMYGMKIVIDDSTVDSDDIKKYVKYIDKAHAKMKAKGFAKAWYGTFLVECSECGGVNKNTGGGTGGSYNIAKDSVSCFSRPSEFVVELLVHELGHRYWYKQMTSTQRAKFDSLVKVRPTPMRPDESDSYGVLIDKRKTDQVGVQILDLVLHFRQVLKDFQKSKLRWFSRIIDAFYEPIASEARSFKDGLLDAIRSINANPGINPRVKKKFDDVIEIGIAVQTKCFNMDDDLKRVMNHYPDGTDFNKEFKVERDKWIEQVQDLLNQANTVANDYLISAASAFNAVEEERYKKPQEEWDRKFREDTRPVAPVSDYGGSNIDEAFAEAFTHYVLEMEMDRDQIESFKSVFSSIDQLVALVAQRYLQEFS